MKFWVGVTDRAWFEHLRARAPDEVVLGIGDRIEVGDTVLVIESARGA